MHVKKGDTVVVIAGKDKGKRGKVLVALPRKKKVIVEGVNLVKRHMRPTRKISQGGIIEKEAPVAAANVLLYCPRCERPVRAGKKVLPESKVRICKKCGEVLEK